LDGLLDEDERYFHEHGEPLFSSHMIDLSEEPVKWNIETTAKYLKRAAPMKQWLEMVRANPTSLFYFVPIFISAEENNRIEIDQSHICYGYVGNRYHWR
jgi:hypothetical protein